MVTRTSDRDPLPLALAVTATVFAVKPQGRIECSTGVSYSCRPANARRSDGGVPRFLNLELRLSERQPSRVSYRQILSDAANMNVDGDGYGVDTSDVRTAGIGDYPDPHRCDLDAA